MGDTPPPPPQHRGSSVISLLNHGRVKTSLSVVACCSSSATPLFTFCGWTGFSSTVSLSIFFLYYILSYVKGVKNLSWGGRQEVWAFLSTLDRDPHPTCARCRGKICTKDLTCDFCAVWSAEQWERFTKKRSYKERKKHRPSGFVPPTQQTSPRAETSSGVLRPGNSSSSRPLGGQGKQEGSRGAPGVVSGGAPSPPARPRSSERGGSVSGLSSGAGVLAPASPAPSPSGVGVACSLQTPFSRVSDVVDSPQFSPHVPRRGNSRESSASCSRVLSSRGSRS